MACTPTPTQTIFTTTTSTTSSVQTITTSEVDTITQASLITTTTCNVENTTTCLSSAVVTLTTLVPVVTTVPVTTTATVPVYVTQAIPVQTLFSNCPSNGDTDTTPINSPTNENTSTSTPTRSVITVTHTTFITTYSDSDGLHTSASTGTTLNAGGGNGNKSSSKTAPIVGGIVGGVVVILAIIGLVWYILWRRNQTKFLFEEDDDDVAPGALRPKSFVGRKGRRSLNLDEEVKGESNAYQYGVVGGTPSPSASPLPHSQYSSLGGYSHRRNGSRDALMASGGPSSNPSSPSRLDIPLAGGHQRRISQNSSARGESIMMQPPVMNRPSDDVVWGHHPRPSSSLLEAPVGQGFYQQYGPLEPSTAAAVAPAGVAAVNPTGPPAMHRPALEPTLLPASQSLPPHQALISAAGLAESAPGTSRGHVMIAPPPGAGGARPFVERPEVVGVGSGINNAGVGAVAGAGGGGDLLAAVMAGADRATSVSPTSVRSGSTDVGFGRQRRPEKTPRVESPRSPVVQHQDAGRVSDTAQPAAGAEAPPPAYSQS